MSRSYIPRALRQLTEERAQYRCEYCLVHKEDAILPHEPDHVISEQHGGKTELENLAFACFHCNRNKGPNLTSIDPETGHITPIFNPRQELWESHFHLVGAFIEPLTSTARATINLLKLNLPERLAIRQELIELQRYPHA
ncbi:MAG: HNH endonuclease [Anaerolineales bacterium]|nr:HNH endonuclease [Anaerolineales bacterium]